MPREIHETLHDIAGLVRDRVPAGVAFALLLHRGAPGARSIMYASTGERRDMIAAFEELVEKLRAGSAVLTPDDPPLSIAQAPTELLEIRKNEIAQVLGPAVEASGWGFVLLLAHYGAGGRASYIASDELPVMIEVIETWLRARR